MTRTIKTVVALVLAVLTIAGLGRMLTASVQQVPSNTWAATGDMATPRAGAASTLLFDGNVIVTGGLDASGAATAGAERYVPGGRGFLQTPPMGTARANHTSTLLPSGKVLVAGGIGSTGTAVSSAEIYDPIENTW